MLQGPNSALLAQMAGFNQAIKPPTDYSNPADKDHARLKKVAQQFESVFVKQLMDAMDKTVDRSGMFSGGQAEDTFRGLMNQYIAENIASRPGGSGIGLAESIYRQAGVLLKPSKPIPGSLAMGQSGQNAQINPAEGKP